MWGIEFPGPRVEPGIAREVAVTTFPLLRERLLVSLIKHNTLDRPFGGNFGHKTHGSAREKPAGGGSIWASP